MWLITGIFAVFLVSTTAFMLSDLYLSKRILSWRQKAAMMILWLVGNALLIATAIPVLRWMVAPSHMFRIAIPIILIAPVYIGIKLVYGIDSQPGP